MPTIPTYQTLRTSSDTGASWVGIAALTPPYALRYCMNFMQKNGDL